MIFNYPLRFHPVHNNRADIGKSFDAAWATSSSWRIDGRSRWISR